MTWSNAIKKIEKITFQIWVKADDNSEEWDLGTGFIVDVNQSSFTIATAAHVIESLFYKTDKFARLVELRSGVGDMCIRANAVGVCQLGCEDTDVGLLWVGSALSQEEVDEILMKCVKSDTQSGILDLSGGGGVIRVTGSRPISDIQDSYSLKINNINMNMDVAWLGFSDDVIQNYTGVVCGFIRPPLRYLANVAECPNGVSGGPVFDVKGNILGIVLGNIKDENSGNQHQNKSMVIAPVSQLQKMLS